MREPVYYVQDFTLISRAEAELYAAQTAFRENEYAAAEAAVTYARHLLQQVLQYDIMVPDERRGAWMRKEEFEYLKTMQERSGNAK